MRFFFLVEKFFTGLSLKARARALSFRHTVMMFSSVRMMPNGSVEYLLGLDGGRIHQHEHMAVLKIDAAAFFLVERGAHEVRLDAQLGTHGCHFFLGGRAQMHPRAGHDLLQLAQLAIVGKINRNHTISMLSAPKRTAAEIRKRRCAKRCSIFAGMIALEDRPPRTVTPFLCQLLRFRRRKSPRASKDSSVHEVPAEQELYYY